MANIDIRLLETPEELTAVEELQRIVWSGDETEIVPVHIFRACVHNGGLVLGAYHEMRLIGFVFGFPGYESVEGKMKIFHASHMAGVHPEFRNAGIGYKLKRAQWQIVRRQGIERITWTYDPLQSRNANLNLSKLGAVCNTYIPNYYGQMRDGINAGMPSDRFQVDWWVNTNRVKRRLTMQGNLKLGPSQYLNAALPMVNQTTIDDLGIIFPGKKNTNDQNSPMMLLEVPADIQKIKQVDYKLAVKWSNHIRALFLDLFHESYLATDFIYAPGVNPRCYYVLTKGNVVL